MENDENLANELYEAEQELFKSFPKMKNPDWWENGSDIEIKIPEETNRMIEKNMKEAGIN